MILTIPAHAHYRHRDLIANYNAILERAAADPYGDFICSLRPHSCRHQDSSHSSYILAVYEGEIVGGVRLTPGLQSDVSFDDYNPNISHSNPLVRSLDSLKVDDFIIDAETVRKSSASSGEKLDVLICKLLESIMLSALEFKVTQLIFTVDCQFETFLQSYSWHLHSIGDPFKVGHFRAMTGNLKVCRQALNLVAEYHGSYSPLIDGKVLMHPQFVSKQRMSNGAHIVSQRC